MRVEMLGQPGAMSTVVLTSGIFVLDGLLLAVIGWLQGHGARAAARWNTAQGEVMESLVEQYRYSGSDGLSTAYRARIRYGLRVGGVMFSSMFV